MSKTIFITIIATSIFFSCNDSGNKKNSGDKKAGTETTSDKQNNKLIYLDTASDMRNILCQYWVLQDDAEGLEGMTENSKFEIPYRSFYFATDGSFIKNPRSSFDFGKWVFDAAGKKITLHNTIDKTVDTYTIASLAADELVLVNTGVGSSTNLKFVSAGLRFKDENNEPYYSGNNRWRMAPKQKETDVAVQQRLKENLQFFILYHRAVLATNEKVVSFWGLPSCFKLYGGAVFLKKPAELKESWLKCFYNKDQAMQAYKIADRLIE